MKPGWVYRLDSAALSFRRAKKKNHVVARHHPSIPANHFSTIIEQIFKYILKWLGSSRGAGTRDCHTSILSVKIVISTLGINKVTTMFEVTYRKKWTKAEIEQYP